MKKIVVYNPSVSTTNIGDEIIFRSAIPYVEQLFPDAFYTHISTHLPVSYRFMYHLLDQDYRFVCGTNLLKNNMLLGFKQWDISLLKSKFIGKCILLGVGWWQYSTNVGLYSKLLYRSVLSSEYTHSVRDNYTLEKLHGIGINNVLNTGCPTMWMFTPQFCSSIPSSKSKAVVTTITDYSKNHSMDSEMLRILLENYENVYLWLQGIGDFEYFNSLDVAHDMIRLIPPNLGSYDSLLESTEVDYIGTRLHAGIRALQHKRRTLIIAVDNRAQEIHNDTNLPILAREEISKLKELIYNKAKTDINIRQDAINEFLSQFRE